MFRQLIYNKAGSPDNVSAPFPGGEISLSNSNQLFILSLSHIATPTMGLTTSISSKIRFITPAPVTFPVPSFTRASTATFVNSKGLTEVAPPNYARFNHDPGTLAPKSLFLEEARTKILTRSNMLTNAAWGIARATVTNSTDFPIFASGGVFQMGGTG